MDEKKLNESHEYLRTWLERSRQVADASPDVQQLFDLLEWEKRTLEHRPIEAGGISTLDVDKHTQSLYGRIRSSLPMIPDVDRAAVTHISSATASSTSSVVMYISNVARLDIPAAKTYASDALSEYRQLQDSHQLPEQVRSLLEHTLPTVVKKFNSACDAYQKYRAGHSSEATAALEMRTYLDGLKGELFEMAREYSRENMTLEIVLERLFLAAPTRPEVEEQLTQRSTLIEDLSSLAKRRSSPASHELEALWARVLDHAFIVVGALNEAYG